MPLFGAPQGHALILYLLQLSTAALLSMPLAICGPVACFSAGFFAAVSSVHEASAMCAADSLVEVIAFPLDVYTVALEEYLLVESLTHLLRQQGGPSLPPAVGLLPVNDILQYAFHY